MYTIIAVAAHSYPRIRIQVFVSIVFFSAFICLFLVSFDAASALKTYYYQVVFLGRRCLKKIIHDIIIQGFVI
jgi:hypothetical protein